MTAHNIGSDESDWGQEVFDGSEAAQDALHSQAGCELALRMALDGGFPGDTAREQMVCALVDCMAHFRCAASQEVTRVQAVSFGH